ncbi:hypothetical protein OG500_02690 [Kitasatospora sp. NBC_01250]|uniref:hypothetical protein n=1 Tax=unclassified Kitasatospora TaxID=2633591 RepID=UPI002E123178|nr:MULTISPECIES: hypothetical protein [unclassified Kitasatospora]WSJ71741.1 hypothetical protein OG294_02625 [Kitasatospora sp. NBC_01302]
MKWLMLYARSRQVPVWAAAVALTTLAACVFEQGGREPMDLGIATLILTTNVTAASVGLGGQDLALDRTAAIRWAPRRTAHVLLLGAVAAVALLAVQVTGPALPPAAVVLRDSAGLAGLAALGAAVVGAAHAWTLPTGWLALSFFTPPLSGDAGKACHWMLEPAGTPPATWTACVLLATGTVLYALTGSRR